MVRKLNGTVKKESRNAGSKRITIAKHKGRIPRRIVLRDGRVLDVLINERPMMNVIVDKVITEHSVANTFAQNTVLYDRAEVHLRGNDGMRFNVIDNADLRFIKGLGDHQLCMRLMNRSEVNRLPKSVLLMDAPKVWYKVEPSVDLAGFFRDVDWKKFSWLYLTENIEKDYRLVEWFKGVIVPMIPKNWLDNSELSNLQFYNNNSFLLTNSQTGKSELARLVSVLPVTEYSQAGLFGGTFKDEEVKGELHGYGLSFFDECTFIKNYDNSLLIPQLLTYLSHGTSSRALKVGIKCRGTKTIVFASNPPAGADMLSSVFDFLKVVAGFEYPQKIGSRVGSVLIGDNFKRVAPDGFLSTYRDATSRILDQVYRKYYFTRIYKILKTNMQWARSDLEEVENLYHKIAMGCPNDMVKKFILGLKMSVHKLKMSAIRSVLFSEMDDVVIGFNKRKFQKEVVEKMREEAYQLLVSINIESLEQVSSLSENVEKTPEFARNLKKKFPSLSLLDIAKFMDVGKTTVHDFLKSDSKGQ